jgi:hypothetical protein
MNFLFSLKTKGINYLETEAWDPLSVPLTETKLRGTSGGVFFLKVMFVVLSVPKVWIFFQTKMLVWMVRVFDLKRYGDYSSSLSLYLYVG